MENKYTMTLAPLTDNEAAWISFLRQLSNDNVPGPTLLAVQALRLGLAGRRIGLCEKVCSEKRLSDST
jgi:hypothetical protein